MVKKIGYIDIINVLNIVNALFVLLISRKLILISAILYLIVHGMLIDSFFKKREIPIFRYIWSFICTSLAFFNGYKVLSDMNFLLLCTFLFSLLYATIILKNNFKKFSIDKILLILVCSVCLSVILGAMIFNLNSSFTQNADINLLVTVKEKFPNRDLFGTHWNSFVEVFSEEEIEGYKFGSQIIGNIGKLWDKIEIGDNIEITIKKGLFNILYCYLE